MPDLISRGGVWYLRGADGEPTVPYSPEERVSMGYDADEKKAVAQFYAKSNGGEVQEPQAPETKSTPYVPLEAPKKRGRKPAQ